MNYLLSLFFVLMSFIGYSMDSLIYRQFSAGINFASFANASPELVSEFVFNQQLSAKLDVGYRPYLNTLELSKKLSNRKVGGSYARLGLRYYNRSHSRKKAFFTGAGILISKYTSSANVVVRDYFDSFIVPQYTQQFTYGTYGNIGFERKIGSKLRLELGGGYNFLLNGNDSLLNHFAHFSSAQPGLGNFSFSMLQAGFSNGINLSFCLRYILYYRNDALKYEEADYAK